LNPVVFGCPRSAMSKAEANVLTGEVPINGLNRRFFVAFSIFELSNIRLAASWCSNWNSQIKPAFKLVK